MMKKIHLTEKQIENILSTINEDGAPITIDATADVAAAGGNAQVGMKKAKDRAKQTIGGKDVTLTCDADAVMESFTKKQIKTARLKHLNENSKIFSKSDFRKKFL